LGLRQPRPDFFFHPPLSSSEVKMIRTLHLVPIRGTLQEIYMWFINYIQGEHKVFLWIQTFITRKLREIHTYFLFQNVTQPKKFFHNTLVHFKRCSFCIPRSCLVINIFNQGKTLCSPCIFKQCRYYKKMYMSWLENLE